MLVLFCTQMVKVEIVLHFFWTEYYYIMIYMRFDEPEVMGRTAIKRWVLGPVMHVVLRDGKFRPMSSRGLPDVQSNQPNPGPLIQEKKKKELKTKEERPGLPERRVPIPSPPLPLQSRATPSGFAPSSRRFWWDRSLNHPGIAMLRKAVVAFIACAALYLAFSAYSRRQVWLSVLQFVWSGSVVKMSDWPYLVF